jgi:hypothetical protein
VYMCVFIRVSTHTCKLWVRRLTLAPSSVAGVQDGPARSNGEEDECISLLAKEQMARMIDILIISEKGNHPRPHVHGVEPEWRLKFWASGEDDDSSVESCSWVHHWSFTSGGGKAIISISR